MEENQQPTNEIQLISTTDALSAVTSAEIDKQIATAHQYPRNVSACIQNIQALATMDEEIAESCYYHLERTDKKTGEVSIIEGPSIRLAEIVASNWGNLRIATRVVGNDGKMVTVEGVCHDLESNVAVSQQQVRSIMGRYGTYSNDMQVMTINAASAVAVRNAINKVIPKAITNKVVEQCKALVRGKAAELPEKRQKIVKTFASLGVSREQLLEKLGISSIDEITADMVVDLRGLFTALKENTTTIEEEFPKPKNPEAEAATKRVQEVAANARAKVAELQSKKGTASGRGKAAKEEPAKAESNPNELTEEEKRQAEEDLIREEQEGR